ncbi:MAG: AMP-binding protein [Gammaproteobacteria bacterium]|nr:AMP-binding protein [Gammaproteobacteria bacterium]
MQREPQTYAGLLLRSFILGGVMRRLTQPGEHVGLLLPNTVALAVSFLALQYLGRVPAMLNITAGAQGLQRACSTGNVKRVFTSRAFVEKAGFEDLIAALAEHVDVIYLEDLRAGIGLREKLIALLRTRFPVSHYRRQIADTDPDSPAVILFTSGSEGTPRAWCCRTAICVGLRPGTLLYRFPAH